MESKTSFRMSLSRS